MPIYIGNTKLGVTYNVSGLDIGDTIPQIYNNILSKRDTSQPLKIIGFGSSWFMNTWWYLNKILQSAGINAELKFFYAGGASFLSWIQNYEGDRSVSCYDSVNGSDWTQSNQPFKTALQSTTYDIIAYQQGAFQAIDWNGAWENDWSKLVGYIKQSCGPNTTIAFNSTWTPAISYSGLGTIQSQKDWQQINYANTRRFMALSGIYNASPNGAALWAMRRNPILNTSNDLASDSLHPDNGLPMYGLSGTFYETFIAPIYNISFSSIDWTPDITTQKCAVSGTSFMTISPEQKQLIRSISKLSLSNKFGFSEL